MDGGVEGEVYLSRYRCPGIGPLDPVQPEDVLTDD